MKQHAKSERMAILVSNIANMALFIAKIYASIDSRSLAVIASTLDSLLDLLAGFILWFTSHAMKTPNQYRYPIGKKRMQPVVSLLLFFLPRNTLVSGYFSEIKVKRRKKTYPFSSQERKRKDVFANFCLLFELICCNIFRV